MNAPREDTCRPRQGLHKKLSRRHKFFNRIGLRPRLLSAFFLVSLVPLLLLFCAQYQITKRSTLDIIEAGLVQVADVQQRRVNLELLRLSQQLQLVASRTQMRISLAAYNQTQKEEHLLLLRRILTDALLSLDNFIGIWIRNPQDLLVTGVHNEDALESLTPVPPVLNSDDIQLELEWAGNDAPHIWMSGPLLVDDDTIGSIHILVGMDVLYAVLEDFSCEYSGGESLLLLRDDNHDLQIAGSLCPTHSDANRSFYDLVTNSSFGDDMADAAGAAMPIHHQEQIVMMRALDHGFGKVVAHVSTNCITEAFWHQMRFLVLLALLAVALVLFLAFRLSRMIAQPLQQLTKVTADLQDGASDGRIKERFWGEFTDLARSFNQAMRMLSKRTGELHEEIEARRRSQQKLVDLANTDTLTGLINRRYFMERLREILSSPGRERQPAALLYLDLDDFKPINDRMGHEAGDLVLQVVAGRIRHLLREGDLAARLGGDEFALLLMKDGSHHLDPDMVARRVEEQLTMPMTIKNQVVIVGCSVGVVQLAPGDDPEGVLNRADQDMYRVKRSRRDDTDNDN